MVSRYPQLIDQTEPTLALRTQTTFVREVTAVYRGPRRTSGHISGPQSAAEFIRKILPDNSREHFVALYLDGEHKVIAFSVVSTGSANLCQVHPREVFQMALLSGAISIIVAHNHPSGSLKPSPEDHRITTSLKEAGELLRVKILDHVIVGETSHFSFSEDLR